MAALVHRRRWLVPETIYDLTHPFAVDEHIKALANSTRKPRLSSRWKSEKAAIGFGRRCLEVAILGVEMQQAHQPGDWIADWERTGDKARSAADALRGVVNSLAPPQTALSASHQIARPLAQMRLHETSSKKSRKVDSIHRQGEQDAKALWRSLDRLEALASWCQEQRDKLAQSRSNPGDPEKRVFVETLCEGWVILTGRMPGSNPVVEKNPFLRFVQCAWGDAGHEEEADFAHNLRTSLAKLQQQDLELLVRQGPSWQRLG